MQEKASAIIYSICYNPRFDLLHVIQTHCNVVLTMLHKSALTLVLKFLFWRSLLPPLLQENLHPQSPFDHK